MARLILGLGVVIVLMGLWTLALPDQLMSLMDWESRAGLYVAAMIRLVTGMILIVGAKKTRYPKGLLIFGVFVLIAGVALLLLPTASWVRLIRWSLVEHPLRYRIGGGLGGILVGGFLVRAALPERPAA